MHRIYSLLRSNKQSGPFSLEELLHLNLKKFDLIWVEGKSGWSYPSEVESLKPFLTETNTAPEENKLHILKGISEPSSTDTRTPETGIRNVQHHAAPSHVYVSLPASASAPAIPENGLKQVENEESPEAKLERKAQELRNKIQAFTENKTHAKADNELAVKYTRSLDDIKDEYSSWLSEQKKRKFVLPKKQLAIAGGVAVLIFAGYFIAPLFYSKTVSKDHILSAQEILSSSPTKKEPTTGQDLEEAKNGAAAKLIKNKKISSKNNTSYSQKTTVKKNEISEVDKYLDSLNRIPNKEDYKQERIINSENPQTITPPIKHESITVPFEQLVKLAESSSSETSQLSLYNNSDKFIRFVAVDVFYLKSNKKLLLKKTFYLTDISAMSSAKLYVPKEKGAASVRYEMGLISTDGGLYYAKN